MSATADNGNRLRHAEADGGASASGPMGPAAGLDDRSLFTRLGDSHMVRDVMFNDLRMMISALNHRPAATTSPDLLNQSNHNNNAQHGSKELHRQITIIIPSLLIVSSKAVLDQITAIILSLGLFIVFSVINNLVRHEVALQSKRRISVMVFVVCLILLCVILEYRCFTFFDLSFGLLFIPRYSHSLTISGVLWSIAVDDYLLKLITIVFKIVVIMMPTRYMLFIKRRNVYVFIEATSQLFRFCVPIQSWLYYMLESYQGPKKIFGIFLSALYIIFKTIGLVSCVKLWWTAYKLFQNVAMGTEPSKEQLAEAGSRCPICHDKYVSPVLLQCHHIFCETCITFWLDRILTCPLCRAKIVDNKAWRDGSTTHMIVLF